jgi:hypothetical protein
VRRLRAERQGGSTGAADYDEVVTLTTTVRSLLAAAATVLCVPALAISVLEGDSVLVPFFAALSVAAGVAALLARRRWEGWRRGIGMLVGIAWVMAGVAISLLVGLFGSGGSLPTEMPPEPTYLGLTASFYHLVAICGGGALIVAAVFAPEQESLPTTHR